MEDAIYDKEDKDFVATTPLCKHARDKVIIGGMHGSNSGQPCLIACDFYQKQCSCFHFFFSSKDRVLSIDRPIHAACKHANVFFAQNV